MDRKKRLQTHKEELVNSSVHGLGILLSMAGLAVAVAFACMQKDPWKIMSVSIYGSSLIILYLTSTLYHGLRLERLKYTLRIIDHCAIYLVIAGTYTPFALIALRGWLGWSLFGVVWTLAIIGILFKIFLKSRFKMFSIAIYLGMGWLCLVVVVPLANRIPVGGVVWLAVGGVFYTFGVIFYLWQRIPFHHSIWHLFVLLGSISHYLSIFFYVIPM